MRRLFAWTTLSLFLSSCASYNQLSPEERAAIERDVVRGDQPRFLRVSFYLTPFFGDASKRFLTPLPPDEVHLLEHPNGEPVNPGPVEKMLPAGTPARILKVEFPTAWVIAERIVYTPRHHPWVFLEVDGEPKDKPFIVVLRPQLKSHQEFVSELERFVSTQDPKVLLEQFSEPVREAIKTKNALVDMPADALEMAWGYPERKNVTYDQSVREEKWLYPGQKRVAYLNDGRVVRVESGRK
jgi:hypothetical protein